MFFTHMSPPQNVNYNHFSSPHFFFDGKGSNVFVLNVYQISNAQTLLRHMAVWKNEENHKVVNYNRSPRCVAYFGEDWCRYVSMYSLSLNLP